jgi:excisionase family DNA binding protein
MIPFYTKKELAELFNISISTIDRLCAAGKLPFHRVGSRKRFTYEDVNAYLDSRHCGHLGPFRSTPQSHDRESHAQ